MIEIRGSDSLINVTTTTEWDPNANNYAGANKVVVTVSASSSLTQMQTDFYNLKAEIEAFIIRDKEEAKLREDYPALKEVYEQYQMVKHLVEDAKKEKPKDET